MFRLQNNTPPVYIEQSRDFQLFCRLYDCVNNSVRFDINSIPTLLEPEKINDKLLSLLSTKQGFFTKQYLNSNELRQILSAFPYIIKYKGTEKGIQLAVNTILKIDGIEEIPSIVYLKDLNDNLLHSIKIYTEHKIKSTLALDELLKYVLPVGYTYELAEYVEYDTRSVIHTFDTVNTLINPAISTSQVIGSDRFAYNILDVKIDLILPDNSVITKVTSFDPYHVSEYDFNRNVFYINLNELFKINNLIDHHFKITLSTGAKANITWNEVTAKFTDKTSAQKEIKISKCILKVAVDTFTAGDTSAFGFRTRMEQLFIGATSMTQVIGSEHYLSTGKYSNCNDTRIANRATIDASTNGYVETKTYGVNDNEE